MKVSSSGFGKVQRGQEVNVKLNGFPYMEFGILKGLVKSISQVPEKHRMEYVIRLTWNFLPD